MRVMIIVAMVAFGAMCLYFYHGVKNDGVELLSFPPPPLEEVAEIQEQKSELVKTNNPVRVSFAVNPVVKK